MPTLGLPRGRLLTIPRDAAWTLSRFERVLAGPRRAEFADEVPARKRRAAPRGQSGTAGSWVAFGDAASHRTDRAAWISRRDSRFYIRRCSSVAMGALNVLVRGQRRTMREPRGGVRELNEPIAPSSSGCPPIGERPLERPALRRVRAGGCPKCSGVAGCWIPCLPTRTHQTRLRSFAHAG